MKRFHIQNEFRYQLSPNYVPNSVLDPQNKISPLNPRELLACLGPPHQVNTETYKYEPVINHLSNLQYFSTHNSNGPFKGSLVIGTRFVS